MNIIKLIALNGGIIDEKALELRVKRMDGDYIKALQVLGSFVKGKKQCPL